VADLGFNRVRDNVARHREWARGHPGVTIRHHDEPGNWHWEASWTDEHDQDRTLRDGELSGLLDQLAAEPEFG